MDVDMNMDMNMNRIIGGVLKNDGEDVKRNKENSIQLKQSK
jgi:hypothetical protein